MAEALPAIRGVLERIDVLVDSPYDQSLAQSERQRAVCALQWTLDYRGNSQALIREIESKDDASYDDFSALVEQDIDSTARYYVSKKKSSSQRRRRGRPSSRKRPPSPSREVQLDGVVDIIFNLVYGYGKLLLPTETVVAHVLLLNRALAERQKSQGRAFTLDELDKEYAALMDWLVAQDLCWHEQDVPPFISKEEWLRAQQTAIQQLANGKEVI